MKKTKPIDPVELVKRLAEIEKRQQDVTPEGWYMPELQPEFCGLVLDLLGVPKDGDSFSRDFDSEQWMRLVSGEITAERFVEMVGWSDSQVLSFLGLIDS